MMNHGLRFTRSARSKRMNSNFATNIILVSIKLFEIRLSSCQHDRIKDCVSIIGIANTQAQRGIAAYQFRFHTNSQ